MGGGEGEGEGDGDSDASLDELVAKLQDGVKLPETDLARRAVKDAEVGGSKAGTFRECSENVPGTQSESPVFRLKGNLKNKDSRTLVQMIYLFFCHNQYNESHFDMLKQCIF